VCFGGKKLGGVPRSLIGTSLSLQKEDTTSSVPKVGVRPRAKKYPNLSDGTSMKEGPCCLITASHERKREGQRGGYNVKSSVEARAKRGRKRLRIIRKHFDFKATVLLQMGTRRPGVVLASLKSRRDIEF